MKITTFEEYDPSTHAASRIALPRAQYEVVKPVKLPDPQKVDYFDILNKAKPGISCPRRKELSAKPSDPPYLHHEEVQHLKIDCEDAALLSYPPVYCATVCRKKVEALGFTMDNVPVDVVGSEEVICDIHNTQTTINSGFLDLLRHFDVFSAKADLFVDTSGKTIHKAI